MTLRGPGPSRVRGRSLGGGLSHRTGIRKIFLLVGVNKPSHSVSGSDSRGILEPSHEVPTSPALTPVCSAQARARAGGDNVPGAVTPARGTWQGQGMAPVAAGLRLITLCLAGCVGQQGLCCSRPRRCWSPRLALLWEEQMEPICGCLKGIRERSVVTMWMMCFKSALK